MKKILGWVLLTLLLSLSELGVASSQEIIIKIQKGRFMPSQIEIPVDTKVRFIIENLDDTPEEFESHDLNREVLIKANSKASFYIGPLSPGHYQFEGEFSPETAQGLVIVQ